MKKCLRAMLSYKNNRHVNLMITHLQFKPLSKQIQENVEALIVHSNHISHFNLYVFLHLGGDDG